MKKFIKIYLLLFIFSNFSKVNAIGVEEEVKGKVPSVVFVSEPFPNPFSCKIQFIYALPKDSKVKIKIYDIAGRLCAVLGEANKKAGCYRMCWSGRNEKGKKLKSGIYFLKIEIGEFKTRKKVVLLRL